MATLKYPPFKANATINEVANGRQTLKRGSQGEAVRLVQKALIDLAFSMPSGADGSFGGQTHAAVVQFQNKWGLTADGICGRETVAVLDVSIATHHGFIPNPTPQPVPASELQTLRFWINAFIPDPSISPDVKPAPGASAGGSMVTVPWPFNAYLKRCFLGDHRGYSNSAGASARIHAEALFVELNKPIPIMQSASIKPGETLEIDPGTGVITGRDFSSMSRCRFSAMRTEPAPVGNPNGGKVSIDVVAAAANPLFDHSPDIDFNGVLQIDRQSKQVTFSGLVDGFPAFEAWVSVNGGEPQNLFKMPPIAPFYLAGDANRNVSGAARLP